MVSEVRTESSRVFKRQFSILEAVQESPDRYRVKLLIHWTDHGKGKEFETEITFSLDQFLTYRKFQKEILKQTGALVFDQRLEIDGVSRWPAFLSNYLGEVAK